MNRLELILPRLEDKEPVLSYKEEFIENGDSMDGTGILRKSNTYEDWYKSVYDNMSEETVAEGLVPAHLFLAISKENGRLIGIIDIRHKLNEFLLSFGGNIGYSVRKSERQKGYATEILSLALEKCKELGLSRVLITCDKDNIGSKKTIMKNGGVFENEVNYEDNIIIQRYWIDIK